LTIIYDHVVSQSSINSDCYASNKFTVKEIESNAVTINGPDAEIGDSYENDDNDDISSVSSDFEHDLSLDFFPFFDSEVV
jgi:hypothetical protein